MATATEEPPVASVLDSLSSIKIIPENTSPQPPEQPVEVETPIADEKPPESVAVPQESQAKTGTPVPIEIPPELKGKARDNFARLEAAKREAEEKASRIEQEWTSKYAEAQKKIQDYESRIPADFNPEALQQQLEERDRRLQELQNEYKLVALERDPDFVAAYDRPRQIIQDGLKNLSLGVGVSEQDFHRAFQTGDQNRLEEIRDILPAHLQRKWDASFAEVERIGVQRDVALRDKEATYQQITKQREEQARQQYSVRLQEDISLARSLSEEPFQKIEAIRDDTELKGQITQTLEALAGGKGADQWTKERVLRQVASSLVLQKFLGTQNQIIEGMKKDVEEKASALAERDKKIAELEEYIQNKHGGMPNNEVKSNNGSGKLDTDKPIWENLVVQPR